MTSLFESTSLAGLPLQNRIVMAPLTRNRSDAMGVPGPFVRDYYSQRASAGLIVSEGTQTSFAGQGYARTPGIHTPEQIAAWKQVTDAVHARGAKMFMQFMHCGRIAHPLNRQITEAPVAPSAIKPAGQMWTDQQQMQDYPTPRAFETAELPAVIEEFVTAGAQRDRSRLRRRRAARGQRLPAQPVSRVEHEPPHRRVRHDTAGPHPLPGRSRQCGGGGHRRGPHRDPPFAGTHVQ